MKNPWEEIPLDDYENHMRLGSVMQLQAMNELMKGQFSAFPVRSVMILGVAGGNGLEHIRRDQFEKVYGVDINSAYLEAARRRHPDLDGLLECLQIDLTSEAEALPRAGLVIANLLVEYIGYECFQRVLRHVKPEYVSCVIQINTGEGWVSDSPYLHAFDGLDRVHHQMEPQALERALLQIRYRLVKTLEYSLPNGKKLIQMDFSRAGGTPWN